MKLLVLGDSYTIGEGVHPSARWPSVLAGLLKKQGRSIDRITYIARTGWTSRDLLEALEKNNLQSNYQAVFLLIGVNNQYQGLPLDPYAREFEKLLEKAIQFAGGMSSHVFVLSIPDWGVSPFAAEKNTADIARQIDQFNEKNAQIAHRHACVYVDITQLSRNQSAPQYFTSDNLHPSPLAYDEWANTLVALVRPILD